MIKTLNSHELNNILYNANDKLKSVENEIFTMKDMVSNRLNILHDEVDWQNHCIANNDFFNISHYKTIPLFDQVPGDFSVYYLDVLPKLISEPINVFNITSTQHTFFREDVKLLLDEDTDVTDILKADSLKTTYFYKRFELPSFTLSLRLDDPNKPIGHARFNVVEIDAFMPGSFTLENIILHHGTQEQEVYTDFYYLGKNRIVLPEKKQVSRIDFEFKINHLKEENGSPFYPFAIKHLYLLDIDFDPESFIVVPVKHSKPISIIKDECVLVSNQGVKETTLKTLKAEVFAYYDDNQPYFPLTISTSNAIYEFPIVVDTIYIKVPIKDAMSCLGVLIE